MGCSRCGSRKSIRPVDTPSSVVRGQKPKITPNPLPSSVHTDPRSAITGLKYVPNN